MTHEINNAKKEIDYECEVSSQETSDRIAAIRYKIMRQEPFYSSLAMRLNYVERTDIPTAAVDGKNFLYNKHFINALSDEELTFVFCHEILHLTLKHLTRRGKRNPSLWNTAADYVINYILVRDGIGKFPEIGGLYDKQYADMYTEEVYVKLEKEDPEGQNQGRNFDVHVSLNPSDGEGDGDGKKQQGQGQGQGGSPDENGDMEVSVSADQLDEMDQEITAAVIEAAKNARMHGAGRMPGEISRLIEEYLEPKVDWREFIQATANGQVKSDYDRRRPNRRFPVSQYKVVLPSMATEDHVEFTLAIDTSGSISQDMLREFVSEVRGIAEQFSSFEINMWCFDTRVYTHRVFTSDNVDDIDTFEIEGGGGTDFDVNWEYMKSIDHTPNCFLMMTDGFPWQSWGDEDYCDTIFLIHDESAITSRVKAPFGTTLYFQNF